MRIDWELIQIGQRICPARVVKNAHCEKKLTSQKPIGRKSSVENLLDDNSDDYWEVIQNISYGK